MGTPRQKKLLYLLAVSVLLSILLPTSFFAWVAWREYRSAMQTAEATAQRTVAGLREHAVRILESKHLWLEQLGEELAGRDWSSVEADSRLHGRLAKLASRLDPLSATVLVDADGAVRLSTRQEHPAPYVSVADREYFRAHKVDRAELFIGSQILGKVSKTRVFTISKALWDSNGAFKGVAATSVSVEHFVSFWKQVAPDVRHIIPMIREDGEVLVRYPSADTPPRLDPNGPFMQQIRRNPYQGTYIAKSRVDGVERLNAYSKIDHYPLYISFSVETQPILAAWRDSLLPYVILTLLAILALLAMNVALLRLSRQERVAAEKWKDTADRLQLEIDRRTAAEAKFRQAQKMETIGQITGGVAHDFNNLLQALSNNLALAERTASEAAPKAFIKAAFGIVARAANLTKQLLAYSRRQPLEPRPFDPQKLVRELTGLLRTTVGSGIELKLDLHADRCVALADVHQAEMAILNLAINARDAMPDGGTLVIGVRKQRIEQMPGDSEIRPGDYISISVKDTGQGMPPEVLERAVEPFFTTKGPAKGSGLGLSQVHGFAAQSGGGIDIESRPGEGTTVTMLLPQAAAGEASGNLELPPEGAGRRAETVLLVDDDDDVRSGVAANLVASGYALLQAPDAARALELLEQRSVDVLVTDYAMPGMNGSELIERAKSRFPSLKTLLITGFADLPPGRYSSATEVLHKPFTPDALARRLQEMLADPGASFTAAG